MTYDKTTHRWYLEVDDTEEFGDISAKYGSQASAEQALKSQSRSVYRYIYARIPLGNKDVLELALAKDTRYLPIIKEALLSQLEYDLTAGGNDVAKQIGIDFKGGGNVDEALIRDRQIGIEAKQALESASSDINIFYAGDYGIRLGDTRYVDYDY